MIASSISILISLFVSYAIDFTGKNWRNTLAFENLQAIDRMLEKRYSTQTVSECCISQSKHWWNADLWRIYMQVTAMVWNLRNSTIKTVSQGGILELQESSFGLNLSAPCQIECSLEQDKKIFDSPSSLGSQSSICLCVSTAMTFLYNTA